MQKWIYLSSHFDDVVLSAGGLIREQVNQGDEVEVWTICAGDRPEDLPLTDYAELLHTFWELGMEDVPYRRSLEDAACNRVLGVAGWYRYTMPDNIYRYHPVTHEPIVKVPEDNQAPLEPDEAYLIPLVADFLRKNIPSDWEVVTPLAIGHHRDHILTRKAADRLGFPIWHYVDFPYMVRDEYQLSDFVPAGAETYSLPISPAGLKAWQDGFACHKSQVPFLWVDSEDMHNGIEKYCQAGYGYTLWKF